MRLLRPNRTRRPMLITGAEIAEMVEASGIGVDQFCHELGISRRTYNYWITLDDPEAIRFPTRYTLCAFRAATKHRKGKR